jgi:hypothetical protein
MTKCWLIPFVIAGLFGDKAFADCLPAPDTPASVIEYFQRLNKPLPERFCSKEAPPQASHEPSQESSQAEETPDQYGGDDGPGDTQYETDQGGGYESDQGRGYETDQGGGYESDQGGGYEGDQSYERDQEGRYERDQEGDYEWDQEDGYQGDADYESGDYWKNDDKGHKGGKHRKGGGKHGKGHGKRKSACKKAHMKWNESMKTCSKRR